MAARRTCLHNYEVGYCYICDRPSQNPAVATKTDHKPNHKTDHKADKTIIMIYDSDDDTVVGSVGSSSTWGSKKEAREARRAYRKSLEDELIVEKSKLKIARRELDAYRQDVRTYEKEVDSRESKVKSIERKMRSL